MAVRPDGPYDIPGGPDLLVPGHLLERQYEIVRGLDVNEFSRPRIDASVPELTEERGTVRRLGLICWPGASWWSSR